MKNLTPEMIEKAKVAKTAEKLLEIAKANGVEMTADEATTYFAQLNPKSGELDDDTLDGVAGGCGGNNEPDMYACPYCGTANPLDMAMDQYAVINCCSGCGQGYTVTISSKVN